MPKSLYLIRHGQASFLSDNYDQLSETGRAQSQRLGLWWRDKLRVEAVYHGSLQRQVDTWGEVKGQLQDAPPVQVLPGLNEHQGTEVMHYHRDSYPAPSSKKEALQQFFKLNQAWAAGKIDSGPHENWTDFQTRVRATYQEIFSALQGQERIAVISSGGVIATGLAMALDLSDQKIMELNWQIRNTSLTVLQYSKGKLFLRDFNWVPHLPENLVTYV